MAGPLSGFRIIELAGIGPGPFAGMVLADMGADVVRVDRPGRGGRVPVDPLLRGRRSIAVDLKHPEGTATVLRLIEGADGLIEGYRPGVTERLGLGPDVCLERNPRLIYGRMTGWGQDGPYAPRAGHDINYIALSGTLSAIGRKGQPPTPPLNLVGDFGGGGMLLAFGMVCGLLEATRSGRGQVVDAAMVDGAALLAAMVHGFRAAGAWNDERGTNMLDSGAWFYDVYECADGAYVSIGSIEEQFCARLLELTGLADDVDGQGPWPGQWDKAAWPSMKERMAAVMRTRTRAEWCKLLEGEDVCFAPVLSLAEAGEHPHNRARSTFIELDGIVQPAPAPRFERTPGRASPAAAGPGAHTEEILADAGFSDTDIERLRRTGAVS